MNGGRDMDLVSGIALDKVQSEVPAEAAALAGTAEDVTGPSAAPSAHQSPPVAADGNGASV